MKSLALSTRRSTALALMLSVTFSAACGDDSPTGPGHDHSEPAGMVAELDGATVVSVNAARQVTGSFAVAAGEETGHIHVHLLDEDGDELEIGSGYWLRITSANPAVATIEQHEPGEFEFHLVGVGAGSTTLVFDLMHGTYPNGHTDYKSPNIPVHVAAPQQ